MQRHDDDPLAAGWMGIEENQLAVSEAIDRFAGVNGAYYAREFHKIHCATGWKPTGFNAAAALFGPIWAAARGVWGMFWAFLILEIIAWVQIGRGSWGNPGAAFLERALGQSQRAKEFADRAAEARLNGEDPTQFETLAKNIGSAAEKSLAMAEAASAGALSILMAGISLLLVMKLLQGLLANVVYERQFSKWRISPHEVESGRRPKNLILGVLLVAAIAPLTIFNFTMGGTGDLLSAFPARQISAAAFNESSATFFSVTAGWLDARIDAAAQSWSGFFDSITYGINSILVSLTVALNGTPWPVVMLVICVTAARVAGLRVAVFTGAALAYIALFGYWEIALETVALVGAAALICVAIGVPLGVWFGKSPRAAAIAEPLLDLMQTLPAFVYLIPIIAFFGTGNPPGILATIIFGMPPVIRLTALGIEGVPEPIKEAATAYGASRFRLLKDVELPLALPSIMTGVNQTILMCLSMVVIISLIGGGGLGVNGGAISGHAAE